MNAQDRIKNHFNDSIQIKLIAMESLASPIANAANALVYCLLENKKIIICGNGGSAADSQHFAAELVNRFEIERPSLPAIALTTDTSILTAIANDYAYDTIFSKQINALGSKDDVLITLSTSGNSDNLIEAIHAAHNNELQVIALTGKSGGKIANQLNQSDIEIRVPSHSTARIQEIHMLILHCFCDLIDWQLFTHIAEENEHALEL